MSDGSWDSFVRETPIGCVPEGIVGPARAYRVAYGSITEIRRHFAAVATPEHWPGWVTEGDPAAIRRATDRARRRERARQAATKNYPPPNAKRSRPALFITGAVGATLIECADEGPK